MFGAVRLVKNLKKGCFFIFLGGGRLVCGGCDFVLILGICVNGGR